ncbi:hypothetical protein [Rubripirellula reticaptiva]|uniref:hypothetical protein n=1 Tax=Rubripirellula reticaptiva TaxID=2528013 RepID=UPI0016480635|nr:hypothetical protein [Rubripirellula reticaptiva]
MTQHSEPYRIYWRDDLTFEIYNVREFQPDCFVGEYVSNELHPRVRRLFDSSNDLLPEGDNYAGPGFVVANWSVQAPGGRRVKINFPVPKYDEHRIAWKLLDDG